MRECECNYSYAKLRKRQENSPAERQSKRTRNPSIQEIQWRLHQNGLHHKHEWEDNLSWGICIEQGKENTVSNVKKNKTFKSIRRQQKDSSVRKKKKEKKSFSKCLWIRLLVILASTLMALCFNFEQTTFNAAKENSQITQSAVDSNFLFPIIWIRIRTSKSYMSQPLLQSTINIISFYFKDKSLFTIRFIQLINYS